MAITTLYDEMWKNDMNVLLENAKKSPEAYQEAINRIERRYKTNANDPLVFQFVAKLRREIWPEKSRDSSLLSVITPETFKGLRANYKTFESRVNKNK